MISQSELSQELAALGYQIGNRRLVDWRHKALLPPLTVRGRGKGKGHSYYWAVPDILARAHVLADALDHHVTAERAALLLAFAGFKTDPAKIRQIWVKQLRLMERSTNGPREINEFVDDQFWDAGIKLAKKLDVLPGMDRSSLERLVSEGIKTVCSLQAFDYSKTELSSLTGIINRWLSASLPKRQTMGPVLLDSRWIDSLLALLRLQFSFSEIRNLLTSCPIAEFRAATAHFNKLVEQLEVFAIMYTNHADERRVTFTVRSLFRALLGPILLPLFLRLIHEGHEKRLNDTLGLISSIIAELKLTGLEAEKNHEVKNDILREGLSGIGERVLPIWKSFDLFRLYRLNKYDGPLEC